MDRIKAVIDRLKNIDSQIQATVKKVIEDNQGIIVEMNSELQLFEKGVDRNNVSISSYAPYGSSTITYKKAKRQPTNRVTLRDEGNFHQSFFLDIRENEFEIKAKDWKAEMLVRKYGEAILGLTDENLSDLSKNYVAPEILKLFKTL